MSDNEGYREAYSFIHIGSLCKGFLTLDTT